VTGSEPFSMRTPMPEYTWKHLGSTGSTCSFSASASMACANGCSEHFSAIAACCRTSVCEWVPKALTSTTSGLPVVIVPVLSKMMVSTLFSFSRLAPLRIRMPFRAAFPMLATIAAGVARVNAQGHAITNTDATRRMSPVAKYTAIPARMIIGVK